MAGMNTETCRARFEAVRHDLRAAMRCFVGREDGGGIVVPDRVAEVLGVQVGDEGDFGTFVLSAYPNVRPLCCKF